MLKFSLIILVSAFLGKANAQFGPSDSCWHSPGRTECDGEVNNGTSERIDGNGWTVRCPVYQQTCSNFNGCNNFMGSFTKSHEGSCTMTSPSFTIPDYSQMTEEEKAEQWEKEKKRVELEDSICSSNIWRCNGTKEFLGVAKSSMPLFKQCKQDGEKYTKLVKQATEEALALCFKEKTRCELAYSPISYLKTKGCHIQVKVLGL